MTSSYLKNEDLFQEELEPIEDESDLDELLLTELSDAIVQATDWTTDTILGQIEKERIQLNPNFQRRDAWTVERKSKFIESLFLGFPIPQLVLAELRELEARGVHLILCSTCLDHFGLSESVEVGIVGGMGDIIAAQWAAQKVISL